MPVSTPVSDPIVATEVPLVLHVPPGVASVSERVEPTATIEPPVIGLAAAFTVKVIVAILVPTE